MQNAMDTMIGKRLRIFRKRMNWPLKMLASRLDVSIQQIQRYEQGLNKISASTLFNISRIVDIDIEHFFKCGEEASTEKNEFNIVLVDDHANDAFLFQKALLDFDTTIDLFVIHSGEEASRFFHASHRAENDEQIIPDIIFLAIPMARACLSSVCGIDLLQEIKRQPFYHSTPVIMLTSDVNEIDVTRAYDHNASGVIRKSFGFESIKQQLHATLSYWAKVVILPHHDGTSFIAEATPTQHVMILPDDNSSVVHAPQ